MLDEEEENVVVEKEIPKYRIEYTDMTNEASMLKIIKYASEVLDPNQPDKTAATKLKALLDADKELNIPSNPQNLPDCDEHGVWQVIIGRQFTGSVTFDAENFIYFQFSELRKFFMIFRS